MYSQGKQKQMKYRLKARGAVASSLKRYVDTKTGKGISSILKGIFSAAQPILKKVLESGLPQQGIKFLLEKGTDAIEGHLDKRFGKNETRSNMMKSLSKKAGDYVEKDGMQFVNKLLGNGVRVGRGRKKADEMLDDLIVGKGLSYI